MVSVWDWLNLLNMVISSCIYFLTKNISLFLFMPKKFHCGHKTFFNPSVVWFRLVPQLVCRELCYNKHGHIRTYEGVEETAQGVRALAALPEVLSWIPSPTWWSKTIDTSRECGVLFCSAGSCLQVGHICSYNHIHIHIHFSKVVN